MIFDRRIVRATAVRLSELLQRLALKPEEWSGAAWAVLGATLIMLALRLLSHSSSAAGLTAMAYGLPAELVTAVYDLVVFYLAYRLIRAASGLYLLALSAALWTLYVRLFVGTVTERIYPTLYIIVAASFAGAGIRVVRRLRGARKADDDPRRRARLIWLVAGLGAVVFGVVWAAREGTDNRPIINAATTGRPRVTLDLPDPGAPGEYKVARLFYGSGKDRWRPEYGKGAQIITRPFDGSPFVAGWSRLGGRMRTRYWGFGPDAMPINGRVWYPEGKGPFPLVLVVHGNHPMADFSDPGYGYLGENLASHGFILVSVDQNFLNGTPWPNVSTLGMEPLGDENAARGVLLLEHLGAFREWNQTAGSPFHGKVDMDNIALMGHSRGGEAITIAAAYNRLSHPPDSASIKFDYGFNIRSLVAIATTDKQYRPGGRSIALENVNYLAIQGSNDGEVEYFKGMQQFDRITFTDGAPRFKAGVYVHRANHGQFNSSWGSRDRGVFPGGTLFNRRPLLAERDQQRVANVFITAFLDATLKGKKEYEPLFSDARAGAKWLPDTIYITRYSASSFRLLASYEEDIDIESASLEGSKIAGKNLVLWRESPAAPRGLWDAFESRAVYLGWDFARRKKQAAYGISLPPDAMKLGPASTLVFALADANEPGGKPQRGPSQPIDLTIELADAAGHTAQVPLSSLQALQAQLEPHVWKGWFSRQRMTEIVFQTYQLELARFVEASPAFDPATLAAVRFVFDRTEAGVVVLDDVGFKP